jgi:hypothetical protein
MLRVSTPIAGLAEKEAFLTCVRQSTVPRFKVSFPDETL